MLRRSRKGLCSLSSVQLDEIVNLCKKKGFIFTSNAIYDSSGGFYDYGPLGVELKNNIKRLWWRDMVQRRPDVVGLDSAIVGPSAVFKASGHLEGFSDPMVDCKSSKLRYRADQLFYGRLLREDGSQVCYLCVPESPEMKKAAFDQGVLIAKKRGISGPFRPVEDLQELTFAPIDLFDQIPSPATREAGHLTPPRDFNLMFETRVGAVSGDTALAYLRPETAQGIFTNFANVLRTSRKKLPFGIAQIGKAFRNEITPRNFIFRSREFEQMEIEYFVAPDDESWRKYYREWIEISARWLRSIGLKDDLLGFHEHSPDKLAHYAKACTDITFRYPFGQSELMGIAARGNYDLKAHMEASGQSLDYSTDGGQRFVPHVIEPSLGVDRLVLALLVSSYKQELVGNNDTRVVLQLAPSVAPIKVGVFPLVANKPELVQLASKLCDHLRQKFVCEWDVSGAIGRRYRRADEAGIPFCVTVDFQSLEDKCVTIRDRDSMAQERIEMKALDHFIQEKIEGPIKEFEVS